MQEPSKELDALANQVIGAAIEVHRILGPGHLEIVYEEALCVELGLRDIPYTQQSVFSVDYKDHRIGEGRLDLLVDNQLIIELKAVERLLPIHTAQAISYLKALNKDLALLMNFHERLLKDGIKRIILS